MIPSSHQWQLLALHLLPIGLLPFNQAAAFQADASKEPPGPAVREDGGRAPQGDVSLQIPAKQRVSSHLREALHPQTVLGQHWPLTPRLACLPSGLYMLASCGRPGGLEGCRKGGSRGRTGPRLSPEVQCRGHKDSFHLPAFLSPNREYSPGAKDWALFTLRVFMELRHLFRWFYRVTSLNSLGIKRSSTAQWAQQYFTNREGKSTVFQTTLKWDTSFSIFHNSVWKESLFVSDPHRPLPVKV